eukprot:g3857.t1
MSKDTKTLREEIDRNVGNGAYGTFSLQRLKTEPEKLQREIENVDAQIKAACLDNYDAYIENHGCFEEIEENAFKMSSMLETSVSELPKLVQAAKEFGSVGKEIADLHEQTEKTLHQHTQLLELLEVPQLMETCVRSGLFEKALDLLAFAKVLEQRHLKTSMSTEHILSGLDHNETARMLQQSRRIVSGVVEEVRECIPTMQHSLLRRLCGNIQFPQCLKLVGYLKRLERLRGASIDTRGSREDRSLSEDFLRCREESMNRALRAKKSADAFQQLVGVIETSRVYWFDIVTQHQAIFTSDASSSDRVEDERVVLSRWILRKTRVFVGSLKSHLERIKDGAKIASAYEHCAYFGSYLGQIGADFRSLLPPIFENRMHAMIVGKWKASLADFARALPSTFASQVAMTNLSIAPLSTRLEDLAPPSTLLVFPFLAALTNGYLVSFNELRRCALSSLGTPLRQSLRESIFCVVDELASFKRQAVQQLYKKTCNDLFSTCCKIVAVQLVPYVLRCFEAIYPRPRRNEDECPLSADIASVLDRMVKTSVYVSAAAEDASVSGSTATARASSPGMSENTATPPEAGI